MKKLKSTCRWLAILFVLLGLCRSGQAQGFINLDFEKARNPGSFYASNAIPSWTAYINGVAQTYISYNSVSLGAAAVNLEGTNSGYAQIQGNYLIFLQGGFGNEGTAGIGQTGTIPVNALSLIFWGGDSYIYGGDGMVITFDGQQLNFSGRLRKLVWMKSSKPLGAGLMARRISFKIRA